MVVGTAKHNSTLQLGGAQIVDAVSTFEYVKVNSLCEFMGINRGFYGG